MCIFLSSAGVIYPQSSATPASSANASVPNATAVGLGLGLGDKQKEGIAIPISNPTSSAIQILGVQASGDLFIEAFPTSIPAGGTANLTVLYFSTGATSGGSDLVRVLTSGGQMVIPVSHGRPQVVSVSANSLSWAIGDTSAKTVTITISGGATVPQAARALGVANTATISSQGNGVYEVSIQPGNTAEANRFPVLIDLNPALPDITIGISCSVGVPYAGRLVAR